MSRLEVLMSPVILNKRNPIEGHGHALRLVGCSATDAEEYPEPQARNPTVAPVFGEAPYEPG